MLILNVIKVLLGNVFNKLYPFLILNLLAVTVGVEAAGGYAIFVSVSSVAIIFINGGVGPILVRYLAVPAGFDNIGKKSVLKFSYCVSILIILFLSVGIYLFGSDFFSIEISGVDDETFVFLIVSFLIGQAIVSLAKSSLLGLREYNALMLYELVLTIVNLGGLVVAYFSVGLESLKVYLYLSTLLSVINGLMSLFWIVRINKSVAGQNGVGLSLVNIKRLLGFGIPSLANALMFTPVLLMGKLILEHNYGLTAVGKFELAFQWATIVLIVTGVVSSLALPELTVLLSDYSKLKKVYRQYVIVNVVISISLSVLLFVLFYFNRTGFFEFYAVANEIEYEVLFLALVMALFISVWSIQTKVFAVYEKQLWVTGLNLVWAMLCGVLVVAFVPKYGVLGFVSSISAAWLALVLVFFWFNYRFMSAQNEVSHI
tara:strand:+ start:713 stop:1999 length:1287 start_codon:yes stop_codon:yes gene_type:complete